MLHEYDPWRREPQPDPWLSQGGVDPSRHPELARSVRALWLSHGPNAGSQSSARELLRFRFPELDSQRLDELATLAPFIALNIPSSAVSRMADLPRARQMLRAVGLMETPPEWTEVLRPPMVVNHPEGGSE